MATFTATFGFDFSYHATTDNRFTGPEGVESYNSTTIVYNGSFPIATGGSAYAFTDTFTGNGFTYSGSSVFPKSGNLDTWTSEYTGLGEASLTGINLAFKKFYAALNKGPEATYTLLFAKNDTLTGSSAADTLWGYKGNDTIEGGGGKDTMKGGVGNDVFVFSSVADMGTTSTTADVISDFEVKKDKLDLSDLGDFGGSFLSAGTAFSAAGQLRLESGVLYGSTDADADAEFAIVLTGVTALTASNIL